MSKKETYIGTSGLNLKVAINRVLELVDKAPLGGKDEDFLKESKGVIEEQLVKVIKQSSYWEKVKDNLTAKQLLKVLEDE